MAKIKSKNINLVVILKILFIDGYKRSRAHYKNGL